VSSLHFCRSNATYDASWMMGVDVDGRQYREYDDVGSLKVALCLFPAIFVKKGISLPEGASVADALTRNRNFFPSHKERMDLDPSRDRCIAKARVLLL
jgi:hypothetical protein